MGRSTDSLLKRFKRNERFVFFESVGVPEGSPELGKGNSGWVPSVVHKIDYRRVFTIYIGGLSTIKNKYLCLEMVFIHGKMHV